VTISVTIGEFKYKIACFTQYTGVRCDPQRDHKEKQTKKAPFNGAFLLLSTLLLSVLRQPAFAIV
jgi:hypothetical protein